MSTGRDLIVDQLPPAGENGSRLTTWYAQGHSDGLGDRLLMFDNTTAPSWEILRFKPAIAQDLRFATALRHRMETLSTFQHPAFPVVRSIKDFSQEEGLAVVSTYSSGVRLSDALKKPRSVEFAVHLLRQLMPALVALHEHSDGIAHGAVTLDRVVLTGDGRLTIREQMVGSAIEALELSAAELWSQFGILTPPSRLICPTLDARSDVTQLALVALSLMAGRRIVLDEYPHTIREPLERLVRLASLRQWFERALYLNGDGFRSAREASEALVEVKQEGQREGAGLAVPPRHAAPVAPKQQAASVPNPPPAPPQPEHPLAPIGIVAVESKWRVANAIRWAAIAAGVVAIAEAAIIGRLLYTGSGSAQAAVPPLQTISSAPPQPQNAVNAEPTPLALQVEQAMPGVRVLPAVVPAAEEPAARGIQPTASTPALPTAVPPRSGGFRVSSPIELHVLDGERLLGSSQDGPIIVRAGRREFDFVNSVIGYRVRREVDVKPGQITAVSVAIPNGRLNVNATPWASVWIDGTPYGETPLGNLSVVPGEHEIVFRHPQLGERRERTLIRPDTPARVAVNLQR
ncbi:MAG TPA: hypothetical protein VMS40_07950 [Vicinamibacterales bacterium]|nr:hypothetical protein [Vicinamibacterales bacterium]